VGASRRHNGFPDRAEETGTGKRAVHAVLRVGDRAVHGLSLAGVRRVRRLPVALMLFHTLDAERIDYSLGISIFSDPPRGNVPSAHRGLRLVPLLSGNRGCLLESFADRWRIFGENWLFCSSPILVLLSLG
jgi:hypothetical protein